MIEMQIELFREGVIEAHIAEFMALLNANGWLTRKQLRTLTGWPERTIRAMAEEAGAVIVRGPRGFNAFDQCSLDEITHCAGIAEAQGKKMIEYGLALRKRAHGRLS